MHNTMLIGNKLLMLSIIVTLHLIECHIFGRRLLS
jgi:hypothetical protein